MQIAANRGVCVSGGICMLTAPEAFDQDEEGGPVTVLVPDPPEELPGRVTEAVRLHPSCALRIT
ncbi:ferredoxin [Pseudonocardia autotrophica]|uniref:FadD n=2 Tax=Pseudonocardia TaxID=1847 RepID=Q8KRT9_PSEAH|nr:(4Fe-4S)-binding protein [Pseudonocardia autotrophica]GEC27699.1 ferredoxin [Pseudonocardia saturnea]AAM82601.1 PauD [Pseudonocardia autotrophica]AAW81704.1 FadD [Pseudonocardia autotrophica]OSY36982.1 Ferredoxin-1 [Pseudonocardia autotrophica]TDN75665.1 ferredoxin [Pseudonocardia autotrophica]